MICSSARHISPYSDIDPSALGSDVGPSRSKKESERATALQDAQNPILISTYRILGQSLIHFNTGRRPNQKLVRPHNVFKLPMRFLLFRPVSVRSG
jgi:hypothetical protein